MRLDFLFLSFGVGDGAFSSPGAFGFYPWIDRTKTNYGVLARSAEEKALLQRYTAQLNEQGNGSYAGQLDLGSGGTWQVTITAEQNGKLILSKRMNVSATGGM